MADLKELVDKINSNTFTPNDPQEITSTDIFLATHENKTLIEHLLPKAMGNPALLKNTLLRYLALMHTQSSQLNTHRLAYLKYTRLACRYIIVESGFAKEGLDNIAAVNDRLTEYFPGNIEQLRDILSRTSYRIGLGRILGDVTSIQTVIDVPSKIQVVRKMAVHPLYATNRNPFAKALNETTAVASHYSGISYLLNNETVSSVLGPVLTTYDYYTSTSRTLELGFYANLIVTIPQKGPEIVKRSVDEKKAHIDLLSFLYFEGNERLQKEIVAHIDDIIGSHPDDIALHAYILEAFAPEPLGKMMYALHAQSPNILSALKSTSYLKLFRSGLHFMKADADKKEFNLVLEKVINGYTPFTQDLSFHSSTSTATRWLAYLICMGVLPNVQKVYIKADNINMDDHLLLSYLMGSDKLILSSEAPKALAVVSALPPKCIIKSLSEDDQDEDEPKMALVKRFFDEEICELLTNAQSFAGSNAPLSYELVTANNIEIDFTLTKTTVTPGIFSTANYASSQELLRLIMMAFPASWLLLPERANGFLRPFAVHEHSKIDMIHCRAIEDDHPKWVLVYEMNAENKPEFLFDIEIERGSVAKGFFSRQGSGSHAKLMQYFPTLAAGYLPSRMAVNSHKDRTPVPRYTK